MPQKDLPNMGAAEAGRENIRSESPETAARTRQERIADIDAELGGLSRSGSSRKDGRELHEEKEAEYREELGALESAEIPVSAESKGLIRTHLVDDRIAAAEKSDRRLDGLEIERLHRLLLTPEEEKVERESGREVREVKKRSKDGAEFIGRGFDHVNTVEPMRPTVDAMLQEDPDILLIEGGLSLEDFYPGEALEDILKKDPAQVIKEKGEEPYIALLAMRAGKEVRTWDTRTIGQIRGVLKMKDEATGESKYRPQDVTDWIVTYAARRAHQSGVKPTVDAIRGRAAVALSGGGVEEAASLGIELTDENIEAALQRHMGLSLEEFAERFDDPESREADKAKIIEMTEPQLVGERRVTSDVLRDMNIVRDEHAIDVFRELKKRFPDKKLFAVGGASHLTVWKPAIDELYKE